jgi:hypothetical protein
MIVAHSIIHYLFSLVHDKIFWKRVETCRVRFTHHNGVMCSKNPCVFGSQRCVERTLQKPFEKLLCTEPVFNKARATASSFIRRFL